MVEFNDPSQWNAASYDADPIDAIEPLESVASDYRTCALALLDVLRGIDQWMSTNRSGQTPRKWVAVSLALGLSSTQGQTETAIANEWGVTRSAISKDVVTVLHLAGLEDQPAWGLKSAQDRDTFKRTNGRRRLGHRLAEIDSEAGLGEMDPEPRVGDFPAA